MVAIAMRVWQSLEPQRDSERTALGNICPGNTISFQLIKLDKQMAYCRRYWESYWISSARH